MTTLFENATVPTVASINAAIDARAVSKKRGWLPVLTVLFLISYALMTMLIIEQGATIESQRALIRELFRDSTELSAVKRAQQDRNVSGHTQTPTGKAHAPAIQTPSSQYPSTQAPANQTPSSQAVPQHRAQAQKTQSPQVRMPSKPASDLSDDRRSLITI